MWLCKKCGQDNEDSFDTCYKCLTFSKEGASKLEDYQKKINKENPKDIFFLLFSFFIFYIFHFLKYFFFQLLRFIFFLFCSFLFSFWPLGLWGCGGFGGGGDESWRSLWEGLRWFGGHLP